MSEWILNEWIKPLWIDSFIEIIVAVISLQLDSS